jgi:hypothetical protein
LKGYGFSRAAIANQMKGFYLAEFEVAAFEGAGL